MVRHHTIDNLRGFAFILMFIFHLYSIWDAINGTNYRQASILHYMGIIARTLFILLAGYSIYMSYKKHKDDFKTERTKRSITILVHAIIMTLASYILTPDKYIRFGILHFIFLTTLTSPLFAPYKTLTLIIFILSIIIDYPQVNEIIDTITGARVHNSMMDWFPLNKNLPIILLGLVIAQQINRPLKINILEREIPIVTELGKNSLNLYTGHYVIIMIVYKIISLL